MKVEKYAAWLAESGCRNAHLLSIEPPEDLAPGIAYLADQLADAQLSLAQACARVRELEGEREEMKHAERERCLAWLGQDMSDGDIADGMASGAPAPGSQPEATP